ncbi:hypothetical protein BgAZ_103040 [Babesia gibsoni]|uniref:Uncharacterized protein n=1 Tax=Babesia gibsoni TaxID=33632 RepID=A0AAD8PFC9_BABGI|nr:hypothetical protein BgAZ_103040 [Babesia gibsoni]
MSEYHVKVFGVKSLRRRNEISALMSSVSKHIDVIANINNKTFRIYNLFTRSNVQYILLQGGALDSRHLPKFRDVMNELDELIHDKKETMDIINMETFCSVKEQALNDFRRIDTLVEEDAREPPPPPTMFSPSMHNLGSKDKDVKEKERDHFMRQTDVKETPFSEPQKTYRPPRDLIKEKPATGIPDAPVSEPQKTYQPPRDLIKEKPASDIPNAPFYEYQKAYRPPQDAKEEKPATVIPNAPFYEYQKAYRPPQDVNEEKPATGITSGKQQQPSNGRSGVVSDESHFHSDSDGSLYTSYMERKNRSKLHSSQMSLIPLCFMANVIIYMILYG